jgi:phospholipid/cholesterol/gamma-HCH transport system substrate-binding protein
MATSLTSTTSNLDAITSRMNRGDGTLGQLSTNRELFDRLNSMTNRLDAVVANLQQGQGTAGQLLQDKQLYENMNSTVVELRTTVVEVRNHVAAIQKDPKKYLNIRVSLF